VLVLRNFSVRRDAEDLVVRALGARRWLPPLVVGVVIASTLLLPVGRAYMAARSTVGERSAAENVAGSATWENFLATYENSVLYGWSSKRFGAGERRVFPGFVALVLAAVALSPPRRTATFAYGIGLLFAIDLTRGFNGVTYRFLYNVITPLHALRVPARAGMMVGLSVAVLAGFGVVRLLSRFRSQPTRIAVVMLLCGGAIAEYVSWPLRLTRIPGTPPDVYWDILRDLGNERPASFIRHRGDPPPAVLLELPIGPNDPMYMYYSTFHWQTLLNGYSGFFPPSYVRLTTLVQHFPDEASLQELDSRGARYVVIHGEFLPSQEYHRLIGAIEAQPARFVPISRRPWQDAQISVFRLRPSIISLLKR